MTSAPDFRAWVAMASPGERIIYYTGDLYYDRQPGVLAEDAREALCSLADTALELAESDHILLCQRRVCESNWAYIAVRRRQPRRRPKATVKQKSICPTRWD